MKIFCKYFLGGTGLWPVVSSVSPETVVGAENPRLSSTPRQTNSRDEIRRDA